MCFRKDKYSIGIFYINLLLIVYAPGNFWIYSLFNNHLPYPVLPIQVFLTYNVRLKNGLWCTFSSGRVTFGNYQCAFQTLLGHSSLFLTYNVGMKIGLWYTFSSWRNTSGKSSDDSRRAINVKEPTHRQLRNIRPPKWSTDFLYVAANEIVMSYLSEREWLWLMRIKCN